MNAWAPWVDLASKESKRTHIRISVDSWEYTNNDSSMVEVLKEEGRRCSKYSKRLRGLMPRTKEDMEKHMRSSMVSGKTLKGLDLAKQTS